MRTDTVYVVGAGGHAKVVVDALLESGVDAGRISVSDENLKLEGTLLLGLPVRFPAIHPTMRGGWFHVAIGSGAIRRQLYDQLVAIGCRPLTVVHPKASVSRFSTLGQAVFVAANAVVGPGATVGDGVILNHGAVVDHDCEVGKFAHLAPTATLGGGVRVGAQVLIGAGANILPVVRIGDQALIGAGAVVINNVSAAHTYVGVPAISLNKE